jgi:GPH family glycoside/pentoside/hexuronide:cation symporter
MLSYATGDLGINLNFQFIGFCLMFFYTDVFGISPTHVAGLFLIARIWDAINDPIMGYLADHTNTRWGRFRPYLLLGALPLNLILVVCFLTPPLEEGGRVVYAYVTYLLYGMAFTAVGIPYSSLTAAITQDQQERATISSYRMFYAIVVASTIVMVVIKPFVALFPSEQVGYAAVAGVFGIVATGLLWFAFWRTQERVAPPRQDYKVKDAPRLIAKNRALLWLSLAMLLNTFVWVVPNAVAMYYFKYYLENEWLQSMFFVFMLPANALGVFAAPLVSKRYGKRFTFILASALVTLFCLARFFVPDPGATGLFLLIGVSMAQSFSQALCAVMQWGMLPDTVEYGEHRTGQRCVGIPYAFFSFTQKLGMALGAAAAVRILGEAGYVANQAQPASSLLAINGLFNLAPALVSSGCLLALLAYPITAESFERIKRELAQRSAGEPTPAE